MFCADFSVRCVVLAIGAVSIDSKAFHGFLKKDN